MRHDRKAGSSLLRSLEEVVGRRYVLTGPAQTRRYRTGFRFGGGDALAVVRPGNLLEQWRVLELCVEAGVIVIPQASNTGLTGGSTPVAEGYDRDVVIINVSRVKGVHLIDGGRQAVCLGGTTLHTLERRLLPLGREPHSVIGSSCFGASVIGGICNNSGGALTRRGPAYTEMSLFAEVDRSGTLRLVNHLAVDAGETVQDILERVQAGAFRPVEVQEGCRAGSAANYETRVRDVDADTPARFNADPSHLFEASGSAGKIMVFAVRVDTFESEKSTTTFYAGCEDPSDFARLRRTILQECARLPIAGEYLHREAFDLADRYGKDQFLAIELLGTDRLPIFHRLLSRFDAFVCRLPGIPTNAIERVLFVLGRIFPDHLPRRLRDWRSRFQHHLLLRVSSDSAGEMRSLLERWESVGNGWFECTAPEAQKAFLHRFVIAGAAVRYRALKPTRTSGIVALDIALRRNDHDWFEELPPEVDSAILHKIYYGHFFCHVLHQDYIVAPGHDCAALKDEMCALLDRRGARYPAEHNVGHVYRADPPLASFYRSLDPQNRFNPGIGLTSRKAHYA